MHLGRNVDHLLTDLHFERSDDKPSVKQSSVDDHLWETSVEDPIKKGLVTNSEELAIGGGEVTSSKLVRPCLRGARLSRNIDNLLSDLAFQHQDYLQQSADVLQSQHQTTGVAKPLIQTEQLRTPPKLRSHLGCDVDSLLSEMAFKENFQPLDTIPSDVPIQFAAHKSDASVENTPICEEVL